MRTRRSVGQYLLGAIFASVASVAGCAAPNLFDGVRVAADRYGVRDAQTLGVAGRGYLRFDVPLESDLRDVMDADDGERMKAEGAALLRRAQALAITAAGGEIERLPDDGIEELVSRYDRSDPAPADPAGGRELLKRLFAERSAELLVTDIATLAACKDAPAARRFLASIARDIEAPIGDRGKLGRVLLGAPMFLPAVIGAEIADREAVERRLVASFEQSVRYAPESAETAPTDAAALAAADVETLARWYAPVFVQEVNDGADYPAADDQIGRVYLEGSADDISVHVDTEHPTVYWSAREAKIGKNRYPQLIYVAWYPARPALEANDASAGRIDGVVVRVTLDRLGRPAVYEFVRSCGCYHTLWVAEFVEADARHQYGPPQIDGDLAVRRTDNPRDRFVPTIVPDDGAHPHRPVAYVSAGHHLLLEIHPARQSEDVAPSSTQTYRLLPYDTLTRLPLGDGVASMFGSDGLVHDAGRAEGWLLAPTGMLSAGQPRQLGTMKIRMDAYDYDDPRLLERVLRLPASF